MGLVDGMTRPLLDAADAGARARLPTVPDMRGHGSRARGNAGERTRTSKGFHPTGPKPAASASSATPARFKDRAAGYAAVMATPEDRERESQATDETKFEREREAEEAERSRDAERVQDELEPTDE